MLYRELETNPCYMRFCIKRKEREGKRGVWRRGETGRLARCLGCGVNASALQSD